MAERIYEVLLRFPESEIAALRAELKNLRAQLDRPGCGPQAKTEIRGWIKFISKLLRHAKPEPAPQVIPTGQVGALTKKLGG